MTKKERILEILSRKEAATPVGEALLNAARKTEAFARSRPGVGTVAGSIGGGLLGALLSKGSRKKRLRDILLGMGIGGAGGYAAGRYMPPLTGAGKEEYDPAVDGSGSSQEPAKDNSRRKEKAAPQKAQQKAPALTERQKAGQRMSGILREQGKRQAIIGGLKEFGTQLTAPGGYDEFLGNVGGAIANTTVKAKDAVVGGARDLGRGAVDLGSLFVDAMKEKRDVAMGKKLPADIQAEYDRLLKGR
jgi:hypothetical protein